MKNDSYKDVSCLFIAQAFGLKQSRNGNFHCFRPEAHNSGDRHPSLSITNNGFHCFGCGIEGNNVELVKMLLNIDTVQAIKKIEEIANINHKPKERCRMNDSTKNQKQKVHCRLISKGEPRFIWLDEDKLKPREPEQKDLKQIRSILKKDWTLDALDLLGVAINDDPYCLVLPFQSKLIYFNPKNIQSYLVCEGRTDLITLVSNSAHESFGLISRYNKTQKIKLNNGSCFYFILDRDEKRDQLANLIEEIPENAKIYALNLPEKYQDISDLSHQCPTTL
jgi:hypothetical protein